MQGDSVYYNSGYKVGSIYYYSDENIYSNRYCNLHKAILMRNLRLEKVVASKQLRLTVETEEERRTTLEAFLKSWQLRLSFKLDVLTT